jgi:uncharacterized glyoxalase superfamily protein PhnB
VAPVLSVIELVVDDMAATLAFYRELGVDIPEAAAGEDHVDVEVGSMRLAFDTRALIESMDATWTPPVGGHRVALAFRCNTPADVDATYERVIAAGHRGHLEPWDAFWGMRYAVVRDPNGVPVDLFCELEASD